MSARIEDGLQIQQLTNQCINLNLKPNRLTLIFKSIMSGLVSTLPAVFSKSGLQVIGGTFTVVSAMTAALQLYNERVADRKTDATLGAIFLNMYLKLSKENVLVPPFMEEKQKDTLKRLLSSITPLYQRLTQEALSPAEKSSTLVRFNELMMKYHLIIFDALINTQSNSNLSVQNLLQNPVFKEHLFKEAEAKFGVSLRALEEENQNLRSENQKLKETIAAHEAKLVSMNSSLESIGKKLLMLEESIKNPNANK